MSLIHIHMENGRYIARGYGYSYRANNPIEAFIGLKLFRAWYLGLIHGSKFPLFKWEWIAIKSRELSKKYSKSFKP